MIKVWTNRQPVRHLPHYDGRCLYSSLDARTPYQAYFDQPMPQVVVVQLTRKTHLRNAPNLFRLTDPCLFPNNTGGL